MRRETILEVRQYFKEKLLNGEFEFKAFQEHKVLVTVDGEFEFDVWTANEAYAIRIYEGTNSFMHLEFTEKERHRLWRHFEKPVRDYKNGDLRSQKFELYERLREELQLEK